MKQSDCLWLLVPAALLSCADVARAGIANGTYTMTPACATGSRLDDTGGSTTNGNKLQIWAASGGANQNWAFASVGTNVYNMSVNGPYCLDSGGTTTNGSAVTIWACNGNPNQSWTGTAVSGGYTFKAGNSGLCLDVAAAASANGTKVDTYSCNGTNAQTWSLQGGGGLNPNNPPGKNFNLSGYTLQLPTGSSGNVDMVSGSTLAAGYAKSPYFYTDPGDGAMDMMDPHTGWTTSGSLHPRVEFRENAIWPTSGTNILNGTVAITKVPSNTTIAQIFQGTGPSKPLCELQFNAGGTVNLFLENTNQGGGGTTTSITTVGVGTKFNYQLKLAGSTITVIANGVTKTFTMNSSFNGEQFYFKAGDYDQSAVSGTPTTSVSTMVKYYALSITH